MPTHLHETLIELFRARPALAAELLAGALGIEVPLHEQARADPADLPDLLPTEYRADAVVGLVHNEEPVTPLVLGPELVPVVSDAEQASRMPELAVLSAIVHGGDTSHRAVLGALLSALSTVEEQQAFMYLELVHVALPESARRHLEELMSTDRARS